MLDMNRWEEELGNADLLALPCAALYAGCTTAIFLRQVLDDVVPASAGDVGAAPGAEGMLERAGAAVLRARCGAAD